MKEKTRKILKGVFFFISWIVDSVRWLRKNHKEKQENDNLNN